MYLYVANLTKHNFRVTYRLDFDAKGERVSASKISPPKQQDIAPGRQIALGGDLHPHQVTDIVDQLTKFGLVGVVDVPRLKAMAPLVFNTERPVPSEIIRRVHHNNQLLQIEEGRLRRQRAAIAVNEQVQQVVNNQFAEQGIEAAATDKIAVAFEQLEQSEAGESRIEEGYRVDRRAGHAPGGKGKGGGGRGSRKRG